MYNVWYASIFYAYIHIVSHFVRSVPNHDLASNKIPGPRNWGDTINKPDYLSHIDLNCQLGESNPGRNTQQFGMIWSMFSERFTAGNQQHTCWIFYVSNRKSVCNIALYLTNMMRSNLIHTVHEKNGIMGWIRYMIYLKMDSWWIVFNVIFTIKKWMDLNDKTLFRAIQNMTFMTSSNGNIFHGTGHLCGQFTGDRWIELWCFLWSAPE